MKQGSTLFLKGVVIFIGLAALAFCTIVLPIGIRAEDVGAYREILIGMYVTAIPFFIGLYQAWKLLVLIDNNEAFSQFSVQALKKIKYCTIIISVLYAAGMPYVFHVADQDDAPGVVAIGLVIIFASFVVGVFAAVLESLLQNVIDIKAENDLMV